MSAGQNVPNPEPGQQSRHTAKAAHTVRLSPRDHARHAKRAESAASPAGQLKPSGPETPAPPSARALLARGHAAHVIPRLGQAYLAGADREPEAGA